MQEKIKCPIHKVEFILLEGCPQCLAEKRAKGIKPENGFLPVPEEEVTNGLTEEEQTYEAAKADQPELAPETTVALRPGEDLEAHSHFNEAQKLLFYAEHLVILSNDGIISATNDLGIISKLKQAMEGKKREYLDPLKAQADAIRETYSTLMDPIFRADKVTRDKILAYRTEQERIRAEQEEINRLRMEAAQRDATLHNGEISESVDLVEVKPEQPEHYRTDSATLGTSQIWKWDLEDFAKVPDEYKTLYAAKIGKVVRAGVREIPGIRIYSEDILRITGRK